MPGLSTNGLYLTTAEMIPSSTAYSRGRDIELATNCGTGGDRFYGLLAYAGVQRAREIGVRMALGATRLQILRLLLGHGMRLTAAGIALGVLAAAAVTRYLETMLFGLKPLDPITFLAVSAIFAAMATFAAVVPARRAANLDPVIALRCE